MLDRGVKFYFKACKVEYWMLVHLLMCPAWFFPLGLSWVLPGRFSHFLHREIPLCLQGPCNSLTQHTSTNFTLLATWKMQADVVNGCSEWRGPKACLQLCPMDAGSFRHGPKPLFSYIWPKCLTDHTHSLRENLMCSKLMRCHHVSARVCWEQLALPADGNTAHDVTQGVAFKNRQTIFLKTESWSIFARYQNYGVKGI